MRILLLSFLLAFWATVAHAADFRSDVVASNATGRLVAPSNFFFGNLWAGTNVYLEKTNRTGYRIHVTPPVDDSKQFGSGTLTNLAGTGALTNANAFQPASANLTNWSDYSTNAISTTASNAANAIGATVSNGAVSFTMTASNTLAAATVAATNSASVTNWINFRQPASANLTNWSNIPTGVMANVVATDYLTNWANAVSNLAQTKQHGSAALTNWSAYPTNVWNDRQGGSATLTNLAGTGALTNFNEAPVTIRGGFLANSNLLVRAGQGTSNAWVGGTIFLDASTRTTNHTGTANYTNLFVYTVPGNTLTNLGDELGFHISGHFRYGLASTNGFRAIYGTSTLFDTGFLTISNCPWKAKITITRTDLSAQRVECEVIAQAPAAGLHGNGALVAYRTNMPLAQVNGITNIFAFQGESRVAAVITNDYRKIRWESGLY